MTKQPVGYLAVFDRGATSPADLASIEPHEPHPARFATRELAELRKTTFEQRDRRADWSLFTDAIPMYLREGDRTRINPAFELAPFEVRLIDARWLAKPDSWLMLGEPSSCATDAPS